MSETVCVLALWTTEWLTNGIRFSFLFSRFEFSQSNKFFCELFHEKGAAYLNVVLSRSVLTPETLIWRICFRVHRPFLTQLCKISIIPRYLFALCPAVLHGCSAGQQVLTIEPHLQCFARSVTRTCLTCVIPSGDSSGWSVNFNKE